MGRKKSILLGTTVMSIGAILQITAYSVPQMIVGRIVAGLGNGLNTATAPVWQSETSKAAWRGMSASHGLEYCKRYQSPLILVIIIEKSGLNLL